MTEIIHILWLTLWILYYVFKKMARIPRPVYTQIFRNSHYLKKDNVILVKIMKALLTVNN